MLEAIRKAGLELKEVVDVKCKLRKLFLKLISPVSLVDSIGLEVLEV